MAEVMSEALGLQLLSTMKELGSRVDQSEALGLQILGTMKELGSRVDRSEALGLQILSAVQELGSRVEKLETRVDKLEARMDKLEMWMERLGAEFIRFRDEVREDLRLWRVEIQEDNRLLKRRVGVTTTTVVLMASALREPTEFSAELNTHLSELQAS